MWSSDIEGITSACYSKVLFALRFFALIAAMTFELGKYKQFTYTYPYMK